MSDIPIKVELTVADSYRGPDGSGLGVSSDEVFARVDGGPWHRTGERSWMRARGEIVARVEEVLAGLCPTDQREGGTDDDERRRHLPGGEAVSRPDHRKASYAGALIAWERSELGSEWRPLHKAFGLTDDEAAEVERDGYDTSCLPTPLRPSEAPDA